MSNYPKFKTISTPSGNMAKHDEKINELSKKGWVIITGIIVNGDLICSMMVYDEEHPITKRAIQRGRLEKIAEDSTKVKPIAEA